MPPDGRTTMDEADPRRAPLRAGLTELALSASDETVSQLLAYLDLLTKWNRAYNLSAVREPGQMVRQHLLDCLAALPALDRHLQDRPARILDVGSGAGLPGVAWALLRAHWRVCCVDAVAKKASFVRQVAAELRCRNLQSEHARVEQLQLPGQLVQRICSHRGQHVRDVLFRGADMPVHEFGVVFQILKRRQQRGIGHGVTRGLAMVGCVQSALFNHSVRVQPNGCKGRAACSAPLWVGVVDRDHDVLAFAARSVYADLVVELLAEQRPCQR